MNNNMNGTMKLKDYSNGQILSELMTRLKVVDAHNKRIEMIPSEKVKLIIEAVCRALNVSPDLIRTKTRKRECVYARFICYYWLKHKTGLSLKMIGGEFHYQDHSTVLNGLQVYADMIETNNEDFCRAAEAAAVEIELLGL